MKKGIIGTFSKLGLVIGLASILTGTAFAQANTQTTTGVDTDVEIARRINLKAKTSMLRANNIASTKGKNLSANNQASFNIGTNFAFAFVTAPQYARSEDARTLAVSDLVFLINSLEGEPEAAGLKNTLKSVLQKTASSQQVSEDLVDASKSYSARIQKEQLWYYASGMMVTTLYIDVIVKDNEAIKVSLKRIQNLIANAPSGTSAEIIGSMQGLVRYAAQTAFATEDYNALFEGIKEVGNSINA